MRAETRDVTHAPPLTGVWSTHPVANMDGILVCTDITWGVLRATPRAQSQWSSSDFFPRVKRARRQPHLHTNDTAACCLKRAAEQRKSPIALAKVRLVRWLPLSMAFFKRPLCACGDSRAGVARLQVVTLYLVPSQLPASWKSLFSSLRLPWSRKSKTNSSMEPETIKQIGRAQVTTATLRRRHSNALAERSWRLMAATAETAHAAPAAATGTTLEF
jgi:hypothetical protein